MSGQMTYKFVCSNCKQQKEQGAPPDLMFALHLVDKEKNILENDKYDACCSKCVRIIKEHNAPIEAIIHDKSVQRKEAKKKGEAAKAQSGEIKAKPKSQEQVQSLPPAEQTKPDPMALIAGAIASLADAQKATNEKLDKLLTGKESDGKRETIRGPVESGGRRKDTPAGAGNKRGQTKAKSGSRLRKSPERGYIETEYGG